MVKNPVQVRDFWDFERVPEIDSWHNSSFFSPDIFL